MTTTNVANPSTLQQPPNYAPGMAPTVLCTIFFRRSADGSTFTVVPVYLTASDAVAALNTNPAEYNINGTTFAAWPNSYNNSTQAIGGRGRAQGSHNAAG